MSVKHFCDWCGDEVARNFISQRIYGRGYIDGESPALITSSQQFLNSCDQPVEGDQA